MYQLKSEPTDFKVFEELEYELTKGGSFALYKMIKKDYNTLSAINRITQFLNLKSKEVGFCGNKDKIAITEQYITVPAISHKHLENFKSEDITLEYIGLVEEKLNLGTLSGNKFEIVVRNLEGKISIPRFDKDKVPNIFGAQRFSTNNSEIGKSIVKGDFKNGVSIFEEDKQYGKDIKEHLRFAPNEYVGAIQIVPRQILRLCIHAYQSDLWNQAVSELLKQSPDSIQQEIPIVGFGTRLSGEIGKIYDKILRTERLSERDFIIRKIKDLSSEGDSRNLYLTLSDFESEFLEDEKNEGNKKCLLKFRLGKGSYATTLIDFLFNNQ